MKTNIANTTVPLTASPILIATLLTGRAIRYINNKPSTVVQGYERFFKVVSVEDVAVSQNSGHRYISARVIDLNSQGNEVYRNLTVDNIEIVA